MAQETPVFINILEVGPRDGLQNESEIVATTDKLGLITRLLDAGVRRIEVASDTSGQKNQGQTIKQGIKENREMICFAKAERLKAQVMISAAFG